MKEILQIASSFLGVAISLGTLLTVTLPGLRKRFLEMLFQISRKETVEKDLAHLKTLMEQHVAEDKIRKEEMELQKEVDRCVLRDLITNIYYKHAKEKAIPAYELEDATALHELYVKRGGNSYVPHLFRQMTREWTVIQ